LSPPAIPLTLSSPKAPPRKRVLGYSTPLRINTKKGSAAQNQEKSQHLFCHDRLRILVKILLYYYNIIESIKRPIILWTEWSMYLCDDASVQLQPSAALLARGLELSEQAPIALTCFACNGLPVDRKMVYTCRLSSARPIERKYRKTLKGPEELER
jgi:hypothetical protein